MIQRIQTLFLMIACGLLVSLFFVPFYSIGEHKVAYSDSIPVLVLMIVAVVLPLVTIFLYRRRPLQIQLCTLTTIVLLALQGLLAYTFFRANPDCAFSVTAVFPVVAAILTFLALRYIARDEAMVKAADRLRK